MGLRLRDGVPPFVVPAQAGTHAELAGPRRLGDSRVARALDRLEALRGEDGLWHASRRYWRRTRTGTGTELVSWGAGGEAAMLTRHAREVLAAAGRAG